MIAPEQFTARCVAVDVNPRCWSCRKRIGIRFTRPWALRCPRCKEMNPKEVAHQEVTR
jgi:phage FluMu protein Com